MEIGFLILYAALVWAASSLRVAWWLAAVPATMVAVAAVVGLLTYEQPPPEEDAILPGIGEFLLMVAALYLCSAVALGWGVRLWRRGRRAWAVPMGVAGAAPWWWVFIGA